MNERDLIQRWIAWKERVGGRPFPQKDLAEGAGMSPTYLSSILTGARNAGTKTIERIAEAIGVSVASFYSGPPEEKSPAVESPHGEPPASAVRLSRMEPPGAIPPAAPAGTPRTASSNPDSTAPPDVFPDNPESPHKETGLRFTTCGSDRIDRLLDSYGFSSLDATAPPPNRGNRVRPVEKGPRHPHSPEFSSTPEHEGPPCLVPDPSGAEPSVEVPLFTSVPAGNWREWLSEGMHATSERVTVPPVEPGRVFAIRVEDGSMSPKIERDSALVIFPEARFTAFEGGVGVVAREGKFTVRHVYAVGDSYILVPSNPAFYPEVVPAGNTQVFRIAFCIPV